MLKLFNANKKNFSKKLELILNARRQKQRSQSFVVKKILNDVKNQGDKAVLKYERKFSNIKSKKTSIKFSKKEINEISKKINKKLKKSIDIAFSRIKKFHKKQKFSSFKYKDQFNNELSHKYSPIDRLRICSWRQQQVILVLF